MKLGRWSSPEPATLSSRIVLRREMLAGPGTPYASWRQTWLPLALAAVWSVLAFVTVVGVPTIRYGSYVVIALAAGLVAWALLNTPPPPALRFAAGWTGIGTLAILVASLLTSNALLAGVIPGLAVAGVLASRFPAPCLIIVVFFTASFGTLGAFTSVPVGPLVDLILSGLWVSASFHVIMKPRSRALVLWPGVFVAVAYLILTAVEIATAPTFAVGLYAFRSAAWYMLAFVLVAYYPWSQTALRRVIRSVVVIAFAVGAYATFRKIVGPAAAESSFALSQGTSNFASVDNQLRVIGSFSSGHELGAWTGSAIPFLCAFALTNKDWRWRAFSVIGAALCLVGLLGSDVRIALIGVVAGLGLVFALYQFSRAFTGLHFGATFSAALVAAIVGFGIYTQTTGKSQLRRDRYAAIFSPTKDESVQQRFFKWRGAIRELDNHPFGLGLGSAGRTRARYGRFVSAASLNVDNSYLEIAYQQGWAVMGLYVIAAILMLFGLARRAVLSTDPSRAGPALGACGAFAAFLVISIAALYIEGLTALWVWILLGLGSAGFARAIPETTSASS